MEENESRLLLDLPEEMLRRVLAALDGPSLVQAERSCATLRAASGDSLWRDLVQQRWSWLIPGSSSCASGTASSLLFGRLHTRKSARFAVLGDVLDEALGDVTQVRVYSIAQGTWNALRSDGVDGEQGSSCGCMPALVRDAAGGLVKMGGFGFMDACATSRVDRYDPAANVWAALPHLSRPRCCAGGVCDARGALYCVGGGETMFAQSRAFSSAEFLPLSAPPDSRTPDQCSFASSWLEAPSMTEPRCAAGVAIALPANIIVSCGGYGGNACYLRTAEQLSLDSAEPRWIPLPSMHEHRAGCMASYGPDGRFYVLGGGPDGRSEHASMEALDLRVAQWDGALPPAQVGRHYNAAAWGPDERLYVSGAYRHTGQLDVVECYDLRAGKWEALERIGLVLNFSAGAFLL